jgi:hypothetical protein
MSRAILWAWAALVGLVPGISMAQPSPKQLDALVRGAPLIFFGTIEKLGAATTSEITPGKATAVVAVEEVYTPTGGLGDLTNRSITVQLDPKRPLTQGARAVFFAQGVLYGRGIVVREVGRLQAADKSVLRKDVTAALARKEDQKLSQRIAQASLVITGKVVAVRPAPEAGPRVISEHDPQWHEATIDIRSVERGKFDAKEITILFPASDDELWEEAPKFREGQEGVWILQQDQKEKGGARLRRSGYTALDALDFQPLDKVEQVRRLVKPAR